MTVPPVPPPPRKRSTVPIMIIGFVLGVLTVVFVVRWFY
jgi:hypothetical protein